MENSDKILSSGNRITLLITAILLLHVGIRVHGLGQASFWWDESFTWYASLSVEDIMFKISKDVHPPLYFAVMNAWTSLFGISEFSVRFPSVLFSTFTLVGLILLGHAASPDSDRTIFIVALIYLLLPYDLHLARFARGYTMLICMCTLWTFFYLKFVIEQNWKRLIPAVTIGLMAIYAHYLAITCVVATIGAGLFLKPTKRHFVMSVAVSLAFVIGFWPLWDLIHYQMRIKQVMHHYRWLTQLHLNEIVALVNPYPSGVVFSGLLPETWLSSMGVGVGVTALLIALMSIKEIWASLWIRGLFLQAALIVVLMQMSPTPLFNDRNLCILLPSVITLLAYGLSHVSAIERFCLRPIFLSSFVLLALAGFPHANNFPDWREAIDRMQIHDDQGRVQVVTGPSWDYTTLPYYYARGVLKKRFVESPPIRCNAQDLCKVLATQNKSAEILWLCTDETSGPPNCLQEPSGISIERKENFNRLVFYDLRIEENKANHD